MASTSRVDSRPPRAGEGKSVRTILSIDGGGIRGKIFWAQPLLGMVLDGASDTVEHELGQLLSPPDYYRFQLPIPNANREIDDASVTNLKTLKDLTNTMITARTEDLDAICSRLIGLASGETARSYRAPPWPVCPTPPPHGPVATPSIGHLVTQRMALGMKK